MLNVCTFLKFKITIEKGVFAFYNKNSCFINIEHLIKYVALINLYLELGNYIKKPIDTHFFFTLIS